MSRSRILYFLVACVVSFLAAPTAHSHEFKPARAHLEALSDHSARVVWERPLLGEHPTPIALQIPPECRQEAPTEVRVDEVQRSTFLLVCDAPLPGLTLAVTGLDQAGISVWVEYGQKRRLLTADNPEFSMSDAQSQADGFVGLGIEHVLFGIDHLAFVLGLLLLVGLRVRALLLTVSSFTIAHSLTLALAVLGHFTLPSGPVEACIALSVLLLLREVSSGRKSTYAHRHPWSFAFLCGLLHGFGFAGALAELRIDGNSAAWLLLQFNLGVELGQLLFVAVLVAAAELCRRTLAAPTRAKLHHAILLTIGSLAAYWTIERCLSIVSA